MWVRSEIRMRCPKVHLGRILNGTSALARHMVLQKTFRTLQNAAWDPRDEQPGSDQEANRERALKQRISISACLCMFSNNFNLTQGFCVWRRALDGFPRSFKILLPWVIDKWGRSPPRSSEEFRGGPRNLRGAPRSSEGFRPRRGSQRSSFQATAPSSQPQI